MSDLGSVIMENMTDAHNRLAGAARDFIVKEVGHDEGASKQAHDLVDWLVESGVVAAIKAEALREAGTAAAAHGQVRFEKWLYARADYVETAPRAAPVDGSPDHGGNDD